MLKGKYAYDIHDICLLYLFCSTRSPAFVDQSCLTTPSVDMPADLQLPFAVSSDSLWTAAYVAERERREQLDSAIGGTGSADTEDKKPPVRRSSRAPREPAAAETTIRPANEVVIDNLIILLRNKGVPDDEIRTAILHGNAGQIDTPTQQEPVEKKKESPIEAPEASSSNDNSGSSELPVEQSRRSPSPTVDSDNEGEALDSDTCSPKPEPEPEYGESALMEEIDLGGMDIQDIRTASVPLNEALPLTADDHDSSDSAVWDI